MPELPDRTALDGPERDALGTGADELIDGQYADRPQLRPRPPALTWSVQTCG